MLKIDIVVPQVLGVHYILKIDSTVGVLCIGNRYSSAPSTGGVLYIENKYTLKGGSI